MKREDIKIIDGTLREGLQAHGVFFNKKEKKELIKMMDKARIPYIEIGLFITNVDELKEIFRILLENSEILALLRARKEDFNFAKKFNFKKIVLTFPIGEEFVKAFITEVKTSKEYENYKNKIKQLIWENVNNFDEMFLAVSNSINDSLKEELKEFILEFAKEEKIKFILCDSKGIFMPIDTIEFLKFVSSFLSLDRVGVHFHNDFGLAQANTLVAVKSGVKYVTTTINGIGEKAGVTNLAEFVLACELLLHKNTGIDKTKLIQLSEYVAKKTGYFISPKSPVIGFKVFDYESGIPVNALLKNPQVYEPIDPILLGKKSRFIFGKYTGKNSVKSYLKNLNKNLSDKELKKITENIRKEGCKKILEQKKKIEIIYEEWKSVFKEMEVNIEDLL